MADKDNREQFINSLPAHMQTQIRQGIVDPSNLPLETLRDMTRDGADGDVVPLSERMSHHNPLDHRQQTNTAVTGAAQGVDVPEDKLGKLQPKDTGAMPLAQSQEIVK